MTQKKGILERLAEGPVIGDGSLLTTLEKRGYACAGPWTQEAVVEHPDAVRELLREYLRAGSDVIQTPTFYASDGKLKQASVQYTCAEVNTAACNLAREVANEGDAIICGSLSPVMSYLKKQGEAAIREEFENQLQVFIDHDVDFVLAEYFGHVQEIEICIDVMKRIKKPIAATMRIAAGGDLNGVTVEECALRMAKAGAKIIGVNCNFDINICLRTLKRMKAALDKANLHPYLMCQPLGWMCPEVENVPNGYLALPETPLALDARSMTRIEAHKFARDAYNLGVRYIGGCCGVESHHIRAFSQELAPERKKDSPVTEQCCKLGARLDCSLFTNIKKKTSDTFWMNIELANGRPGSKATSEIEACEMIL